MEQRDIHTVQHQSLLRLITVNYHWTHIYTPFIYVLLFIRICAWSAGTLLSYSSHFPGDSRIMADTAAAHINRPQQEAQQENKRRLV